MIELQLDCYAVTQDEMDMEALMIKSLDDTLYYWVKLEEKESDKTP